MTNEERAWQWYRVRRSYHAGYLHGFTSAAGIVLVLALADTSISTALYSLTFCALGAALVVHYLERVSSKDYLRDVRGEQP